MNKMRKTIYLCIIIAISVFLSALTSGCVTPKEGIKVFEGTSTKDVEAARKDASVKVFNYDYDTCYAKAEKLLHDLPNASIYAKTKEMIAIYYIDPNTTPVGVFFKEAGPARTQVEVSSPSSSAKEFVAKVIFSETLPKAAGASFIKTRKASTYSQSVMK